MVLGLSLVIGTLLMGAITTTILQAKTMRHELDMTYALGLAEGTVELAHRQIIDEAASFRAPPQSGTSVIDGHTIQWTATEIDGLVERTDEDGVRSICQPYEISTSFNIGDASCRITRVVDLTLTPIYQYALFYNMLCELSPEMATHVAGRIHVNGDLYLDSDTTLTIDSESLKATGGIYRGTVDEDSRDGSVSIRTAPGAEYVELTEDSDASQPGWTQSALASWQGNVESGAHGAEKSGAPDATSIEAMAPEGMDPVSQGVDAIKAKHDWWNSAFEVHGVEMEGPFINGDQFSVIFELDATDKSSGNRWKGKEVALYEVENGKIARETFMMMPMG